MKVLGYFIGLALAFYFVDAMFGLLGCLIFVALLVLIERGRSPLQS